MARYKLSVSRGIMAGLVGATIGGAIPWSLLCLFFFIKWLGVEIYPDIDGARLGSCFFASLFGATAFASFVTIPKGSLRRDFWMIFASECFAIYIWRIFTGPRLKANPPGEQPFDIVVATMPAVITAIMLLSWRLVAGIAPNEPPVREITNVE